MHPKHTHKFGVLRVLEYVFISVLLLFGPRTPVMLRYVFWVYAIWKFIVLAWGLFACFHCWIRFSLALLAAILFTVQLPFQYYLAALLFVWGDYFARFGHTFINEKECVQCRFA